MDLAIVIVSWNVRQLLGSCLTSIYQSLTDSAYEGVELDTAIWVVDNNSSDDSVEMVRERHPDVELICNQKNEGFAGGNNQGITQALKKEPRYILLLNPDTAVRGKALSTLVDFMDRTPQAGMAGARLVYGDGTFQHSAFAFPGLAQILLDLFPFPSRASETRLNGRYPRAWYAADADPFSVDHPLGATMIVRQQAVKAAGLMDTDFFMYCEEIDWAMRIHAAGWGIFCVPAAEIVHYGGQSTRQIQAESFVNLWSSRHHLYDKHYSPFKIRVASLLVRWGMKRKIREASSEKLREAYRRVSAIWGGPPAQ